jgi:hypothetical protein
MISFVLLLSDISINRIIPGYLWNFIVVKTLNKVSQEAKKDKCSYNLNPCA